MIKIVDELAGVVKENERIIYKLARSFSNEGVEDLFQVGVIGLINAYNSYKREFGTKFSTYAYPFILGEMKKYIRENKGVKVNREIIYLSTKLEKLTLLLCQKYKRMPTTEELAIETGIEEWKIIEALNIRNCVSSLDEPLTDGKNSVIDVIPNKEKIDESIEFNDMLDLLDEEEKSIIKERYFNDKSQEEVSHITGYSQAKVSRCEKKILCKLRNYYKVS